MNSRSFLSLDGEWQFIHNPNLALPREQLNSWRLITVPGPWQAQFDDLRLEAGAAWYRREFYVPASWSNRSAILHFGAVDYYAQVWVNGTLVGDHEGGYLPFDFEIAPYLAAGGHNTLEVYVIDPAHTRLPSLGNLNDEGGLETFAEPGNLSREGTFSEAKHYFDEIPHGKQSWYGPLSGLWQPVWIESRPRKHIQRVKITPDARTGDVAVEVHLNQPLDDEERICITLFAPDGERVAEELARGADVATVLNVREPVLWDIGLPNLYTARVTLETPGSEDDEVSETFGFRTIETRDGELLLNGRPIYLRGALDQDYYPEMIYTPPSLEYIENQFRQAREMGLNCLRVHIKIADPRYYIAADRIGLLIWTELPNWSQLTEVSRRRARQTIAGMIERDWNHPSIIIWTIINEGWGVRLEKNRDHRLWLEEIFDWVKQLDPTRLVVDNSPCFPNAHVKSDLDDFHFYAAMPDQMRRWDNWVRAFANRAPWIYAPDYQENREKGAPLIVSEFGNWGLPDIGPLITQYQGEPWWFATGHNWSGGDVFPQASAERFYALHLDKVFGDYSGLARASQWSQFEALQYQIGTMRLYKSIVGYIITEFTDLHWECNGLLDLLRRPKAYYARLADINADTVIIPRLSRHAFWGGETMTVQLAISHYGTQTLENAQLICSITGVDVTPTAVSIALPPLPAAEVTTLEPVTITLPEVSGPVRAQLNLSLEDAQWAGVARNNLTLSLFPPSTPLAQPVACLDRALAERLAAAGYTIEREATPGIPLIVTTLDESGRRFLEAGGRVLFLAETAEALQTDIPGLKLHDRLGTSWAGSWASSFSWYRSDLWGERIPGDGRFDFSFAPVIPQTVISSTRLEDFAEDVLAGLFVGWLRRPVGLVQKMAAGEGMLLVSTMRLSRFIHDNPLATMWLHEHLQLLSD